MFKTGIYSLEQIKCGVKFKNFLGGEKKISITLYDQILQEPNKEELAERILLLFSDERGAYKRTYRQRFEEFDNEVVKIIQQYIALDASITIQDLGISDGRTSVDFFNKIKTVYQKVVFKASDHDAKVYILDTKKTRITISRTGKLLEIVYPPFVFNVGRMDKFLYYPLNCIIFFIVKHLVALPALRMYKNGKIKAKELLLFAPKALKLAEEEQRFQLRQHDILVPLSEPSHIIRVMNVLNTSYFTDEQFKIVLTNIYNGLADNGLFIVGSNQEAGSTVHGGVYQKTSMAFKLLWRSGLGAAIGDKILNYKN